MNISALRTFLAVVEVGSLKSAADRLNVTQSTVTARLDKLDEMLGHALLVRSRRGARLTRAGFQFRPYAEALVRGWDQARGAVGLPRGASGMFSFASEFDLWAGAGKRWFDRARTAHPELVFEAWPGAVSDIQSWLASGLTDAALTIDPVVGPGLASRAFGRERLVQVTTAARAVQDWDPAYVYVDLGAEFRRQHSETWSSEQTARVTYASSQWALDHLLVEGGSAYLPWPVSEPYVAAGRLHPVSGSPEFSRSLHMVWRSASLERFPWLSIGEDG